MKLDSVQMTNCISGKTKIIGRSLVIKRKISFIHKAARSDKKVLIYGETGTGKELAARKIHELSERRKRPFVPINCTNIPRDLFEAELFGYKRGSFTGAIKDKKGLLDVAEGGTVFFDEIGDISLDIQAKLLRVIERREIRRIGETTTRMINARFIFATNKNFQEEINAGNFRKDLYYRISVIRFYIPPLKERKEDIPLLVDYILERGRIEGGAKKKIYHVAMKKLMSYDFPGNIRELENIIERACIFSEENILSEKDIKLESESFGIEQKVSITREQLRQTLENCHWNKSQAAIKVGKSRRQFYRLLEKYKMTDCIKRN